MSTSRHINKICIAAAAAALVLTIGSLGDSVAGMESGSTYGSFLLPTQAGGYVLAAVVAFAVGVGVTLGIQRYRKKHDK